MFCHNIPRQCLLSADNSQPITLVGPQVVLDRFITTNTRGQPQVIHQGAELIQQCQAGAKIWLFSPRSVYVEVMTPFTQVMASSKGEVLCASLELDCTQGALEYNMDKTSNTLTLKGFQTHTKDDIILH